MEASKSRPLKCVATQNDALLDDPRVHPVAREKFKAVLRDVRGYGLPLMVWEVFRTRGRQRMYYAQGRSDELLIAVGFTLEEIAAYRRVGYTPEKPRITNSTLPRFHGKGLAMDCCWCVNGKPTWNVPEEWWRKYGSAARAHGLVWGGDWKIRDMAHVELRLKEGGVP